MDDRVFADVRRRIIFDLGKWDPQNEDGEAIARYPIILDAQTWDQIAHRAEQLDREMLAAEREIARRPELIGELGLPRRLRRALTPAAPRPLADSPRFTRFDFHAAPEGWRISEANSDVPGGFLESSGLARVMHTDSPATRIPGDPAEALVAALAGAAGPSADVALVHATAYVDDRQVMLYLARVLERHALRPHLVNPAQLDWSGPTARTRTAWREGPIDAMIRFFPAEWHAELPRSCGWAASVSHPCLQSNPLWAILSQSKRFPLVWDRLRTPLPTWRRVLPETRDPRDAGWSRDESWVLKPALGRVGSGIGIRGVTPEQTWRSIARSARVFPGRWAVQRRFEAVPLETPDGVRFPTFGVFVVAGRVAGCYARVAARPLIDGRAQDAAVFVALPSGASTRRGERADPPERAAHMFAAGAASGVKP